jgi:hypothetical protein
LPWAIVVQTRRLLDDDLEPVGFDWSTLSKVKPNELAVRFGFGALVALVAALLASLAGPKVGGLFLAFPAILPASLTLIEKKEGLAKAWSDASGGALGAVGIMAFALVAGDLPPGTRCSPSCSACSPGARLQPACIMPSGSAGSSFAWIDSFRNLRARAPNALRHEVDVAAAPEQEPIAKPLDLERSFPAVGSGVGFDDLCEAHRELLISVTPVTRLFEVSRVFRLPGEPAVLLVFRRNCHQRTLHEPSLPEPATSMCRHNRKKCCLLCQGWHFPDPDARLRGMAGTKTSAANALRQPWKKETRADRRSSARGRATFHLPLQLLDEVRNTVVALSGPPAQLTMSKFAESALRRELDRLRTERPGLERGKPFDQREGRVRRGRPLM